MKQKKTNIDVLPVILCGGSGTRLWPLSRKDFPKQFLHLNSPYTLFQHTVKRGLQFSANMPLVIAGEAYRFQIAEQFDALDLKQQEINVILEPEARNTAPALTLAALNALHTETLCNEQDPILVVMPSDHIIVNEAAFQSVVQQAIQCCFEQNKIIMLGIEPHQPETAYGYIQTELEALPSGLVNIQNFVEKPNLEKAKAYLAQKNYYWNAGIFILKASQWLASIQQFRVDIAQATELAWRERSSERFGNVNFIRPSPVNFAKIPAQSIDYAVMEPTVIQQGQKLGMLPLNAGWNDLGAWEAIWQTLDKDPQGNVCLGDVQSVNCQQSLLYSSSRLVAAIGLENIAVVETDDAVLVVNRQQSQDVKLIVEQLKTQDRPEYKQHRKVYRPWGWYDELDQGEHFKVRRIQVKPQHSVSLQTHQHRAEHWIVIKGIAEVRCETEKYLLKQNESIYVPMGKPHQLTNISDQLLEIIEVQSGDYLSEEDIIRLAN